MAQQAFVTSVQKAEESDEAITFTIDDHELRAFKPTEGQFALLVMVMGRHNSEINQASGVLEFFINLLDEPSQEYVINRMMSRKTAIDVETIIAVMRWLIEEWGGRPFQSQSGSTPSRQNGGKKSKGRTSPSTSSESLRTAS